MITPPLDLATCPSCDTAFSPVRPGDLPGWATTMFAKCPHCQASLILDWSTGTLASRTIALSSRHWARKATR